MKNMKTPMGTVKKGIAQFGVGSMEKKVVLMLMEYI